MSKIPTAEKFLHQSKSLHDMWDNTRGKGEWDEKAIVKSHIEFAKLHVEACKKEISKSTKINLFIRPDRKGSKYKLVESGESYDIFETRQMYKVDKESILNAYPLTNIK